MDELLIKGQLSEKGYLKESYCEEIDDLKHSLTQKGRNEIKEILKEPEYQRIFLQMALNEAGNNPKIARDIVRRAISNL